MTRMVCVTRYTPLTPCVTSGRGLGAGVVQYLTPLTRV